MSFRWGRSFRILLVVSVKAAFVGMLPYLDQAPLYNLAQGGGLAASVNGSQNYFQNNWVAWDSNHRVTVTKLTVLLCPSDSDSTAQSPLQGTNYATCRGDTVWDNCPEWTGCSGHGLRGLFVSAGSCGAASSRD